VVFISSAGEFLTIIDDIGRPQVKTLVVALPTFQTERRSPSVLKD